MKIRNMIYCCIFLMLVFSGCSKKVNKFEGLNTPGAKENAIKYSSFFLPEKDGNVQPYVGDTMPYYEDGTYYIYYLKDGGDSYNHSVYLATTSDFITYKEIPESVLESSRNGGQDSWIGTGSLVKFNNKYLFFYTGHTDASVSGYKEKIMVAEGDSPFSFTKKTGWYITPPSDLNQKNDFRDPQAYYDEKSNKIILTVTASKNNVARILKYSLSPDLTEINYEGIIFTDPIYRFWNLECSDTFKIGNKYYLTYSAQDDTLWYASSDNAYGPYTDAKRLEGKLFYAAKHVDDGANYYMVGWLRRSESPSSTQDVSAWAGNLAVQKIVQKENGELILAPVEKLQKQFTQKESLLGKKNTTLQAGALISYQPTFDCPESFCIEGNFKFSGSGSFGLSFDYNGRQNKNKMISISPSENKIQLLFNEGSTLIAESEVNLQKGKDYSFTYIQEGSVGIFYINGEAALSVRLYGVSGNKISLFAENNAVAFTSLEQRIKK